MAGMYVVNVWQFLFSFPHIFSKTFPPPSRNPLNTPPVKMTTIQTTHEPKNTINHNLITELPKPLGFPPSSSKQLTSLEYSASTTSKLSSTQITLIKKRAMDLAMSPGKQLGMNVFMMYMSGRQLNMWTITMVVGGLVNPLTALFNTNKQFKKFEDPEGKVDLLMAKLVWLLVNCVGLCMGLYKMNTMGLLPATSADWVDYIVRKDMAESSSTPV